MHQAVFVCMCREGSKAKQPPRVESRKAEARDILRWGSVDERRQSTGLRQSRGGCGSIPRTSNGGRIALLLLMKINKQKAPCTKREFGGKEREEKKTPDKKKKPGCLFSSLTSYAQKSCSPWMDGPTCRLLLTRLIESSQPPCHPAPLLPAVMAVPVFSCLILWAAHPPRPFRRRKGRRGGCGRP